MQTLTFHKTLQGNWFIVLPEWEGDPSQLQMVLGANTLLDELSPKEEDVSLLITTNIKEMREESKSTHHMKSWDWLQRADFIPVAEGYYYNHGSKYLWLCPVTQFVFGEFPKIIYFKTLIK